MIMASRRGSSAFLSALLLIMICHYANSYLIAKPADAEAVAGLTTFFNCSTTLSSEIHWFHYSVGDTKDRSFVYGYDQFYSSYLGRFQLERNAATGSYNLIISSVTIDDAGRYECQDDSGRGDKDSAQLTVLDESPACQSNIKPQGLIGPNICGFEPDELYMTCGVKYYGNQPPIMQWKEVGSDKAIVEGATRNASSDRVIYYLKMKVNSGMHGSSYQCVTTRSRKSQYGCTSKVVVVAGCFSDIVVAPSTREVQLGGSTYFNCSTSVTSKEVHWFHYPVSSTERSFVYGFEKFYDPYLGRFAIDKNVTTGQYNLVITSVVAGYEGKYECQDNAGGGMKKSAHLVILEADLTCQSNVNVQKVIGPNSFNIEPDQLIFMCMAQYLGNEAPILQWELNDTNQSINNGVTRQVSGNRVIYNLTMTTDKLSDGSFYSCRTTRSTSKLSCKSENVQVVGSRTSVEGGAIGTCNCDSLKNAVICICILLLLPLSIAVVVLTLMQRPKLREGIQDNIRQCYSRIMKPDVTHVLSDELTDIEATKKQTAETELLLTQENKPQQQTSSDEQLVMESHQPSKNNEQTNKDIVELEEKNKQLENKIHALEEWLYPPERFGDKLKLVSVIEIKERKTNSKKETKPISGMIILRNKLFVVTEHSFEIEVYDSVTFNTEPSWPIAGMSNPMDIASCSSNSCLYICDGKSESEMIIFRVNVSKGDDASKIMLKSWPILGDAGHLSVTREGNVVVSFYNENKINEYSPDGTLIREVRLSPADNVSHPWHAIKTTSMHFIFSHGIGDDSLHRVCVAKADGRIVKSFGAGKGKDVEAQHMNHPVHLLEDSSRNVLVADMKNGRVLLLSPTLEYKRILVSASDKHTCKLRFPMRLCFDEEKGMLFVADNNYRTKKEKFSYDGGRILIFNC